MTEPRPVYITEHIPLLEYLAAAERLMHPAVTIIDGDCWDACTLLPNEIDILTLIDEAAANGGVLKTSHIPAEVKTVVMGDTV